jgi:hypothetical protein
VKRFWLWLYDNFYDNFFVALTTTIIVALMVYLISTIPGSDRVEKAREAAREAAPHGRLVAVAGYNSVYRIDDEERHVSCWVVGVGKPSIACLPQRDGGAP